MKANLGVHSELDLLLLAEGVRDVHHEGGVRLEINGLRALQNHSKAITTLPIEAYCGCRPHLCSPTQHIHFAPSSSLGHAVQVKELGGH